jgi:hypothetical protein
MRCLRLCALALSLGAPLGCYSVGGDDDAGPGTKDGGSVDLSRDAGPAPDAGPQQGIDAGAPLDAGAPPDAGSAPDAGPPDLVIVSFAADHSSLALLTNTLLRYHVTGADSCTIAPDVGLVTLPSGALTIDAGTPGESVTYTLECLGPGGPKTATDIVSTTLVTAGAATVSSGPALAGLTGVNVITGNLVIADANDVAALSASLTSLVRVTGNLVVRNNGILPSLDLPNLEEVGGMLAVIGNPALTSFAAPRLARVGERLYVTTNYALPPAQLASFVEQIEAAEGIGGPSITYYNDPAVVLTGRTETFLCTPTGTNPFGPGLLELLGLQQLTFFANGTTSLQSGLGLYAGTYVRAGNNFTLSFPGTQETTSGLEIEYDLVTALQSASFQDCYLAMTTPNQGLAATTTYTCPEVQTSNGGERNQVVVAPAGVATWRHTQVNNSLPGGQRTLEFYGAYIIDGDWLYFVFPSSVQLPPTNLRFPVGKRQGSSLDLIDLLPAQTPCTAGI